MRLLKLEKRISEVHESIWFKVVFSLRGTTMKFPECFANLLHTSSIDSVEESSTYESNNS